jgi:hypothetical protein
MNFFERQDQARRQSKRLILLFVLAVAAIVVAVDLVFLMAFGLLGEGVSPGRFTAGLTCLLQVIAALDSWPRCDTLARGRESAGRI